MRHISRPWLLVILLACVASIAVGVVGCGKDDKATPVSDETSSDSPSAAADDEGDEGDEGAESEGADVASEEAEAADEQGDLETPPAKPDEGSTRLAEDKANGATPPRGDKARDRVKAARGEDAVGATLKAPADDSPAAAASNGDVATGTQDVAPPTTADQGSAGLLSPAERRKVERERRIAELKRRNEERRQARMAKVDDQRRESEAEAAVTRGNAKVEARASAQAPPRGMSLKKYITQADIRKIVSNDTLVEEGGLSGIAPSDTYNSIYFAPPARATFGVAVQVWRDKTRRDANVRFRRMRAQYANAEDTTAPTAKSFVSQWNDILTLSFANLTKRMVVSVSCSTTICKPAQLLAVAKTISAKL